MIGNVNYLGKGLGKAIIKELIAKVNNIENAKRIIVQPDKENKASCNTLRACGFVFDEKNEVYILEL